MKKKWLLIVLSIGLVISLAGCGEKEEATKTASEETKTEEQSKEVVLEQQLPEEQTKGEVPKEEVPKEETPKEETPKEEVPKKETPVEPVKAEPKQPVEKKDYIDDKTIKPNVITKIDLKQQKNKGYKDWVDKILSNKDGTRKSLLSGDNYIVERDGSLYLLNQKSKVEKLIIKGKRTNGEDATSNEFYKAISDTQFIYIEYGYEWTDFWGIFDIQTMKNYPMKGASKNPLAVKDNFVYSIGDALYGEYTGDFNLSKTDISHILSNTSGDPASKTTKLLTSVPDSLLEQMCGYSMSPDAKKFVILTRVEGSHIVTVYVYSVGTGEQLKKIEIKEEDQYSAQFVANDLLYMYRPDKELYVLRLE